MFVVLKVFRKWKLAHESYLNNISFPYFVRFPFNKRNKKQQPYVQNKGFEKHEKDRVFFVISV